MAPRLDDRSPTPTNDELDNRSDCSDGMFNKGVHSSSENHLGGTYQDESGNMVCYCLKQFTLSQTFPVPSWFVVGLSMMSWLHNNSIELSYRCCEFNFVDISMLDPGRDWKNLAMDIFLQADRKSFVFTCQAEVFNFSVIVGSTLLHKIYDKLYPPTRWPIHKSKNHM